MKAAQPGEIHLQDFTLNAEARLSIFVKARVAQGCLTIGESAESLIFCVSNIAVSMASANYGTVKETKTFHTEECFGISCCRFVMGSLFTTLGIVVVVDRIFL